MQFIENSTNQECTDEKSIITGLIGLKAMCKKYEFYQKDEERGDLFYIFQNSFMTLGNLVNSVINIETDNAYEILYLVSKILYSGNQQKLCPFLMQPGCLDPWIEFLKSVLDRPVPFDLE